MRRNRRDRVGNARRGPGYANAIRYKESRTLFIHNIPIDTSARDLRVAFERFGIIIGVYLPSKYRSGKLPGFAYVEYLEAQDASDAQSHMNGQIFRGHHITVVHATSSRKCPAEMGSSARTRSPHHADRLAPRGSHSSSAD